MSSGDEPGPVPAVLTISRKSADDVQDRWVRIFVDDGPERILRYGEVMTIEVAPGHHRLKAHNTLSNDSLEFDAAPGQRLHVRCFNSIARGGVLMMLTTGFAFITVRLELETDPAPAVP